MGTVFSNKLAEGRQDTKRNISGCTIADAPIVDIHDGNKLGARSCEEALVGIEKIKAGEALFPCGNPEPLRDFENRLPRDTGQRPA